MRNDLRENHADAHRYEHIVRTVERNRFQAGHQQGNLQRRYQDQRGGVAGHEEHGTGHCGEGHGEESQRALDALVALLHGVAVPPVPGPDEGRAGVGQRQDENAADEEPGAAFADEKGQEHGERVILAAQRAALHAVQAAEPPTATSDGQHGGGGNGQHQHGPGRLHQPGQREAEQAAAHVDQLAGRLRAGAAQAAPEFGRRDEPEEPRGHQRDAAPVAAHCTSSTTNAE